MLESVLIQQSIKEQKGFVAWPRGKVTERNFKYRLGKLSPKLEKRCLDAGLGRSEEEFRVSGLFRL